MSELRFYSISKKGTITPIETIDSFIGNSNNKGEFLWVDYYKPIREEFQMVLKPLGIHDLTIEDCTDENYVPKIEEFDTYTFIILNSLNNIKTQLITDEVDFIIGHNYLITISGYNSENRRPLNDIEGLVKREINHVKNGPDFLLHTIMDFVIDSKFKIIESLEDDLDDQEDMLINNPIKFDISVLFQLRRQVLTLRKSLFHEREVLVKICRKDCPYVTDKAIYHFRDISDHLSKFFELTETYRDIVTSLMELHMAMINNVMNKNANQTNASVRRLTLISTIFLPLTLIASIGGMSEWSMMTGPSNWKITYPLFFLGMIVIAVVNYFLLKLLEKRENRF